MRSVNVSNLGFDAETLAKLRIARSSNVGPVSYRQMMLRYAKAERVIVDWEQIAKKNQELCAEDILLREIENIVKAGAWILIWGDEDYPAQLAELPDAPIVICGLGDKKHLHARQVAIVGNRSASAAGLKWSRQMGEELARGGVVVTSGLARGIDTSAHEGALAGGGATVAVVAGGVDHIYPPENAKLREQIIAGGCVISEQAWGMAPNAQLFPRRNRIIAGLSLGVVVSEATRHSGSLITAECALNYGREVWAVPGSPADMRSGGPNWLLKNGATLIEGAGDVLMHLPNRPAPYVKRAVAQQALFDTADVDFPDEYIEESDTSPDGPRKLVYALLGNVPATFDELVRQTKLSEAELSGILVELELDGHAVREADGTWRRE